MGSTLEPLKDGLLVRGGTPLRAQAATWKVVVILQTNLDSTILCQEIHLVKKAILETYMDGIPSSAITDWNRRLERLKIALDPCHDNETMTPHPTNDEEGKRRKRGLLDVIGTAAHYLFGVATQMEVSEIKEAIEKTRKQSLVVAHLATKLVTVVNSSRESIRENRHQLNQITRIMKSVVMDRNITAILFKNFRILQTQQHIDRAIHHLESEYNDFNRRKKSQQNQRLSMELGKLSEELLSPVILRDILTKATRGEMMPIEPIEWYYQHLKLIPIWSDLDNELVFKVDLPLVRPVPYLKYTISAYPVPYINTTTTVRLQAEGIFGLDTRNGDMFVPSNCLGVNPEVCYTGPLYQSGELSCARAIIAGRDPREVCTITITSHVKDQAQIIDDALDQVIVMTWGETFTEHCTSKAEVIHDILPGTYLVKVKDGCTLKNSEWSIPGISIRNVSIFHSSPALLRNSLNLQDLVPVDFALSLPKKNHPFIPELKEILSVKLSDVTGNFESFTADTKSAGWDVKTIVGVFWSIILFFLATIGLLVGLYCCRKKCINLFVHKKKPDLEAEVREVPLLPSRLKLQSPRLNTKVMEVETELDVNIP